MLSQLKKKRHAQIEKRALAKQKRGTLIVKVIRNDDELTLSGPPAEGDPDSPPSRQLRPKPAPQVWGPEKDTLHVSEEVYSESTYALSFIEEFLVRSEVIDGALN